MAKYVELIDKYRIVQSKDTDYNPPSYDWVDNTGEIVRCEYCNNADFAGMSRGFAYCILLKRAMKETDFCSYGEKASAENDIICKREESGCMTN